MNSYYSSPISFSSLLKKEKLPKCDLVQSIKEFLHLIILTNLHEDRRDEQFGCEIWEFEYEILPQESRFQTQVKEAVTSAIELYETRLEEVHVEVLAGKSHGQRKRLEIRITATLKQTAEPFHHSEIISLCPRAGD